MAPYPTLHPLTKKVVVDTNGKQCRFAINLDSKYQKKWRLFSVEISGEVDRYSDYWSNTKELVEVENERRNQSDGNMNICLHSNLTGVKTSEVSLDNVKLNDAILKTIDLLDSILKVDVNAYDAYIVEIIDERYIRAGQEDFIAAK